MNRQMLRKGALMILDRKVNNEKFKCMKTVAVSHLNCMKVKIKIKITLR